MKIKKLIVTGHRGFIGTNFLNNVPDDYEIYGIDALLKGSNNFDTPGKKRLIKEYQNKLLDKELYEQLENDFNNFSDVCVVHFAAWSHVDDSIKTPHYIISENINNTYNIAAWCANKNIPFVNISTDEVYGELTLKDIGSDTSDKIDPRNPYSASKAASEILINSLKHQFPNWKCIQTRCVNNFGKYQDPSKLIPVCVLSILNNKNIPLYGNGMQQRTWIPVDVHNKVVLGLIEKIFNASYYINMDHIYNIGSDYEYTNTSLIMKICELMKVKFNDVVEYINDPRGNSHDLRYHLKYNIIERQFKDIYNFDFDDKLLETINFYIDNKNNLTLWNK